MNAPSVLRALGIGIVAGLRTATAPAAILAAQGSPRTRGALLSALGEYVADKLPFTPSRLGPPALVARAGSGAWCGGESARRDDGSVMTGRALGATGALVGAWAGYSLRSYLTTERALPKLPIALAEDALAVGLAVLAVRR